MKLWATSALLHSPADLFRCVGLTSCKQAWPAPISRCPSGIALSSHYAIAYTTLYHPRIGAKVPPVRCNQVSNRFPQWGYICVSHTGLCVHVYHNDMVLCVVVYNHVRRITSFYECIAILEIPVLRQSVLKFVKCYHTASCCLERYRAPSQYPKRCLFVRSRTVSKSRYWYSKLSYRYGIWRAHQQHCCRSAC